jgi:hypothetical protein
MAESRCHSEDIIMNHVIELQVPKAPLLIWTVEEEIIITSTKADLVWREMIRKNALNFNHFTMVILRFSRSSTL